MDANTDKHDGCLMRETCLKEDLCPMVLVQKLLSGKWKILILWLLSNKTLRYNELLRRMPGVTRKMLTKQLRSLEEDHLITRHAYPLVPPKVEYEITEMGKQLVPIMEMMHEFGASYINLFRDEVKERKEAEEKLEICSLGS
ncbi:winged helix-turn-helix transcriptional regulator [Clostridium sp. C105KSO13]|uniref:winged helix-turn-helix transcriptional regulator n=1 Tax=Clostridium sp. C105KSO13 TaxID=1776045 RepID=UPI0007406B49|nr:helix-turn-helix domain-containing protein [Clostridium sp. C105KSO13]CUX41057.1 HTH-type transcriptional activator HxlR [Clostridium sp. C105KSO13]